MSACNGTISNAWLCFAQLTGSYWCAGLGAFDGICAKCNSRGRLWVCTRCQVVQYCGRICQLSDHKKHKKVCKLLKLAKLADATVPESDLDDLVQTMTLNEYSPDNDLFTNALCTSHQEDGFLKSAHQSFVRTASHMKNCDFKNAEHAMMLCRSDIEKFESTLSAEKLANWRDCVYYTGMQFHHEVIIRALLKLANETDTDSIQAMEMSIERRDMTYVLVTNIVREQAMWDAKKEWKHSVDLDKVCIGHIQNVADLNEDILYTVNLMKARIKHALTTISLCGETFSIEDIGIFTKLEAHINSL